MEKIHNVCVIGAGVMGRQIALNGAVSGFQVVLTDSFPAALEKAGAWAKSYLTTSVEKGKMTQEEMEAALGRLTVDQPLEDALKQADLVIEAIIEEEEAKRELFTTVSKIAPAHAIVTSNSSYIPSSVFAPFFSDPGRLANLHYFNPAMRMKLVEIVRGEHTADETIDTLKEFVSAVGKTYIVVNKEIEGFVVNRLLRAVQDEGYFLLENGIASFEDIDKGAELGLNYPMGPFRLMDLTGLDINYYNRQRHYKETGDEADRPPRALEERFLRGDYGKKTGKGWYSYE